MDSGEAQSTIIAAIQQGDAKAAERVMADHYDLTARALLNAGEI